MDDRIIELLYRNLQEVFASMTVKACSSGCGGAVGVTNSHLRLEETASPSICQQ
jgi:hypothetical protein